MMISTIDLPHLIWNETRSRREKQQQQQQNQVPPFLLFIPASLDIIYSLPKHLQSIISIVQLSVPDATIKSQIDCLFSAPITSFDELQQLLQLPRFDLSPKQNSSSQRRSAFEEIMEEKKKEKEILGLSHPNYLRFVDSLRHPPTNHSNSPEKEANEEESPPFMLNDIFPSPNPNTLREDDSMIFREMLQNKSSVNCEGNLSST